MNALEQYLLSLAYKCPPDLPYSDEERAAIDNALSLIPIPMRIEPHKWSLKVSTRLWQLLRGGTYTEFPLYSLEYWTALRNEYVAMDSPEQTITRAQLRAAHEIPDTIDLHAFLSGYIPPLPGDTIYAIEPNAYQSGPARRKCSKCNLAAVAGRDVCASHYAEISEDTTQILREQIQRARFGLGALLADAVEALGDNVRNAERDADRTAAAAQILDRVGVTKSTAAEIMTAAEEDETADDYELEQLLGRVNAAALSRARTELAEATAAALPQAPATQIPVAIEKDSE